MTGTIRTLRVDKGFGFIKDATGKEYFFHQNAVYGEGLGDLRRTKSASFEVGKQWVRNRLGPLAADMTSN